MKIIKKILPVAMIASFVLMLILPLFVAPVFAAEEPNIYNFTENLRNEGNLQETDLPTFIGRIIKWVLALVGVILIAMFVYGGVMYATSAGSEDKVETGKKVMIYTIVGVVIIALAYVLSDFIIKALFPAV